MLDFGRLIEAAGFPPGVVNIITGHQDVGQALTSHPLVARISFTGGPGAARAIVRNSPENFAEVSLELGGKLTSSCLTMPTSKAPSMGQSRGYSGRPGKAVSQGRG